METDRIVLEVSLPTEDLERILGGLFLEAKVPCQVVPIEEPAARSMRAVGLTSVRRDEIGRIRDAQRILDLVEVMGRTRSGGEPEEGDLRGRVRKAEAALKEDSEPVSEAEVAALRSACEGRLAFLEGLASAMVAHFATDVVLHVIGALVLSL